MRGFVCVVVVGGATKVSSITADDFDIWPHCRKTASEQARGEEGRESAGETANKEKEREGATGRVRSDQVIHSCFDSEPTDSKYSTSVRSHRSTLIIAFLERPPNSLS